MPELCLLKMSSLLDATVPPHLTISSILLQSSPKLRVYLSPKPEHFISRRKSQNFSLNYWENNIELASGQFISTLKIFHEKFTIFYRSYRLPRRDRIGILLHEQQTSLTCCCSSGESIFNDSKVIIQCLFLSYITGISRSLYRKTIFDLVKLCLPRWQ